ncbi:MAG: hypothetical protein M3Q07_06830 [Pseudobdellovibrionaceae bacterium]|nr:hypothetical protein [Pseudobdellovibrionaceae bacterium]
MMKLWIGLISLCSSALFAQDYYSPTGKDKEPLARYPLDFAVENGVMTYSLPPELTGVRNNVSLAQDSENNGIRTFSGREGTAVCMGEGNKAGCVVRHQNLQMNKEAARMAIVSRFADTQLQRDAMAISREFIEHSGNEPIGFIGALKQRQVRWTAPSTQWSTFFVNDQKGGRENVAIIFNPKDGATSRMRFPNGDVGELIVSRWSDFHAAGTWSARNDKGWFDFTFNEKIDKFEGYWGYYKLINGKVAIDNETKVPETTRVGRWHGNRQ